MNIKKRLPYSKSDRDKVRSIVKTILLMFYEHERISPWLFQRVLSTDFKTANLVIKEIIKMSLLSEIKEDDCRIVFKNKLPKFKTIYKRLEKLITSNINYFDSNQSLIDINAPDSLLPKVLKRYSKENIPSIAELQQQYDIGYARTQRLLNQLKDLSV